MPQMEEYEKVATHTTCSISNRLSTTVLKYFLFFTYSDII
jgi:hypothetical protein